LGGGLGSDHHSCRLAVEVAVVQPAAEAVQNEFENCWVPCGREGGSCAYCGPSGACCRTGFASDPAECGGLGGGLGSDHHSCRLAVEVEEAVEVEDAVVQTDQICRGTMEAENAASLEGAQVYDVTNPKQRHAHRGFAGDSFVDYVAPDGAIEWNIDRCSEGVATVSFRYALSGSDRPLQVEVNDEVVVDSLSFPPTGSWAIWKNTASVQIPLLRGTNIIRLSGTGNSGANLDSMMLTPVTMQNMKCPLNDIDRLFRSPQSGSSAITFEKCQQKCEGTKGCNYFSYGAWQGAFVCMGCTQAVNAQSHEGIFLYQVAHPIEEPSHYLTMVSWPAWAWGEWNTDTKGPLAKCTFKGRSSDIDGTGELFTSCCTHEGLGIPRKCETTHNTVFQTAAAQCEDADGRLCTAEEVVALDERGRRTTATQGCYVDGPETATHADLNRLWTSSPCTCTEQGRYIRHDEGTAIYWEECGVKYWVRECTMCDELLDFEDTPCHNHWVDVTTEYINSLSTDGGFHGDGIQFECNQHFNFVE